jgi:hypothetical protein
MWLCPNIYYCTMLLFVWQTETVLAGSVVCCLLWSAALKCRAAVSNHPLICWTLTNKVARPACTMTVSGCQSVPGPFFRQAAPAATDTFMGHTPFNSSFQLWDLCHRGACPAAHDVSHAHGAGMPALYCAVVQICNMLYMDFMPVRLTYELSQHSHRNKRRCAVIFSSALVVLYIYTAGMSCQSSYTRVLMITNFHK